MDTLMMGALLGLSVGGAARPERRDMREAYVGGRAEGRIALRFGVASAHAFYATLAVAGLIEPPAWSTEALLPCTSEEA